MNHKIEPVGIPRDSIVKGNAVKPNYTYRMDQDRWMTVPNLGDEWAGNIEISIVDIEFAE
jgi:hypothetical protein